MPHLYGLRLIPSFDPLVGRSGPPDNALPVFWDEDEDDDDEEEDAEEDAAARAPATIFLSPPDVSTCFGRFFFELYGRVLALCCCLLWYQRPLAPA